MIYVGVDLHLRFCYMTVLDAHGAIRRQGRVANAPQDLRAFFTQLKGPGEEEKILLAVEACGFWPAFLEAVEPLVERVVLVHPARVKAIASAKLKNDRVDSATLAHLLRANLLPASWKADRATRELRERLRLRIALAPIEDPVPTGARSGPSVGTSKPANGGQGKTGQRIWPGTRCFYPVLVCSAKSVFVPQTPRSLNLEF